MNILFPGRPNYEGPRSGQFGMLHHDRLYEYSADVFERVDYIKREKSKHEIPARLYNIICINTCPAIAKRKSLYDDYYDAKRKSLYDDYYDAKLKLLDDDYTLKPLDHDYNAKLKSLNGDYNAKLKSLSEEILKWIYDKIPDCAWNGHELIFCYYPRISNGANIRWQG